MTTHGLDDAIESLRRELGDVRAMNNCPTCECFLGVVAQAAADLKRVDSPAAADAREEFGRWLAAAKGRMRSCQHCEVCVPAGPYQRFREVVGGPPDVDASSSCGPGCRS